MLRIRTLFSGVAISMLIAAGSAKAQGAIAAGMAVSGLIEQLKTAIGQTIDQLDNRVSARSFQMRTELVFLQAELAHSADALVGKTFGELSKQQQLFFESTSNTITAAQQTLKQTDAEIDALATQIEQVAAQFPFVGEEPRVRKSSPSFLTPPASATSQVPVQVDGSFLKHGDAKLMIGQNECKATGHTESKATFVCPGKLFSNQTSEVTYLSAILTVGLERSFFKWIASWFGSDDAVKTYPLSIAVVPPSLGSYEIKATHLVDSSESNSRSGPWGRTNDHCSGRQSFQYNFSPASPEWRIDVNSIQTSVSCRRGGAGHAVRNQSEFGFQIESWARNRGRCERVLGSIVSYDARGCSAGNVSWTEKRIVPVRTETVLKSGTLEWGKAVSVALPPRLEGILVKVNQIDGKSVVLNAATTSKWFAVSRDATSTSVVVSPLDLAAALN